MPDKPTRDDCLKAVMAALDEFIESDVEGLFDQASAAVDALVDAAFLFPAERFDEECNSCGKRIRDHLVDGRCPTVAPGDIRSISPLSPAMDFEWFPEEPDAFGRVETCWAERCERPASWHLRHFGCASPHCGTLGHPRHAVGGEHYCIGHSLERGREAIAPARTGTTYAD